MELLSLELNENEIYDISNNIKLITNIDDSDINIELSSTVEGNIKIRYFTNEKNNKKAYIEKIVGRVTKFLTEYTKYESNVYLEENYFYFDDDELNEIIKILSDEIDKDIKVQLIIKNKLKEVLEYTNSINLDGFVKFRLKFVKLYVPQIVEKCIDSYLIKKEYLEFVNIIKYIADVEEDETEVVNIIYRDNRLQLFDGEIKKIASISNVEISQELSGDILGYDESIINILLNISPKKIILHTSNVTKKDKEVYGTLQAIKHIFQGKIQICDGCEYCK